MSYLAVAALVAVGGIGGFQAIGDATELAVADKASGDMPGMVAAAGNGPAAAAPQLGSSSNAAEGELRCDYSAGYPVCETVSDTNPSHDPELDGSGNDSGLTESELGDEYEELLERLEELEDDSCSGFGCIGKGFGDIGSSIKNGVSNAWDVSSEWVADTATSAASAIAGAATTAAGAVANAATTAWNWSGDRLADARDGIVDAAGWVASTATDAWDTAFEWGRSAVNWTGDAAAWLGNGALNVGKAIGGAVVGGIALAGYGIYKGGEWLVTSAWDAIKATPGFLNNLPIYANLPIMLTGGEDSPLYGFIDNIMPGTDLRFTDIFSADDGVIAHARDAGGLIADGATVAWNATADAASAAASAVGGFAGSVASAVAGGVTNAWNATTAWTGDRIEEAQQGIEAAQEWTGDRVEEAQEWTGDRIEEAQQGIEAAQEWTGDRIEDAQELGENVAEGVQEGVDTATDNRRTDDAIRNTVGGSVPAEILDLAHRYEGNDKASSEKMAQIRAAAQDWAADMSSSEIRDTIESLEDLADSTGYDQTADFAELMISELQNRICPPGAPSYACN